MFLDPAGDVTTGEALVFASQKTDSNNGLLGQGYD